MELISLIGAGQLWIFFILIMGIIDLPSSDMAFVIGNGKVMTYDGENRPLTVSNAAGTTSYEYAPDGTRLKKIDPNGDVTLYLGYAEIRDWGGPNEYVLAYPFDFMRYVEGEGLSNLHRDQLNSVRAISDSSGDRAKRTAYLPFGEGMDYNIDPSVSVETKGFIGERYDEDAGLQYLNARYSCLYSGNGPHGPIA